MTYFGFLALFLGIPIAILSLITIYDFRRGKWLPEPLNRYKAWVVIAGICVVAFVWTTPWDNYLVATRVWWYDINLVTGIVIGYVPIEEYTFFIVQPIFTGLFLLLLIRYLPTNPRKADNAQIRRIAMIISFALWVIFTVLLILTFIDDSFKQFTYLSLEMSWALIPITIQLAFGADILWRHRVPVTVAIVITTLYLAWADSLAIGSGTWTIDPEQSLYSILIGGILPIEEFIFFLITNVLCVFGISLVLAEESHERAMALEKYPIARPFLRMLRHAGHPPDNPAMIAQKQ
ncbi:MAG: lycopene cyclase domain-containing protein [Chloroflexota bacterium]